jgi:hypothetical protein
MRVVVILDRRVVVEEAGEHIGLPEQFAGPKIWVQTGATVERLAAVEELIQVELHRLADALALRAHAVRRVEREGEGRAGVGLFGNVEGNVLEVLSS